MELPKDVLSEILLRLEPRELRIVCNSNSKMRSICENLYFLQRYKEVHKLPENFSIVPFEISKLPKEALFNLLLQVDPNEIGIVCRGAKNPKIREICESDLFKKAYDEKYNFSYFPYSFTPVFLKNPLINFFKNAKFGKYDEKIHSLIDPLLNEGILTKTVAYLLMGIYLEVNNLIFIERGTKYYKVDDTINQYLDEYLSKLEKTSKLNRNKFLHRRINDIISYGIVEFISFYQEKILDSEKINEWLNDVTNKIIKISSSIKI